MECDPWTCKYYALLTIVAIIGGTFAIHILFYIYFSHWYVRRHHSADLIIWKEQRLAQVR